MYWAAPWIPKLINKLGFIVLPLWPIWSSKVKGFKSVSGLVTPILAPNLFESVFINSIVFLSLEPRPIDITLDAFLIPGEFTGELALFKRGIYEAFAEALEDTFICMIKHQDFKKLLLTYPLISTTMLEELANRLAISEEQTAWVATETVKDRLIHYLSRSASFDSDGNSFFDLNMSKKDLAYYLGTTPESLSREWTNLELLGTIRQIDRKKVQLHGLGLNIKSCVITNH